MFPHFMCMSETNIIVWITGLMIYSMSILLQIYRSGAAFTKHLNCYLINKMFYNVYIYYGLSKVTFSEETVEEKFHRKL